MCQVQEGKVNIENNSKVPIHVNKTKMNIRKTVLKTADAHQEYKKNNVVKIEDANDNIEDITTNMQRLNDHQRARLQETLQHNKSVFNQDLNQGYNHKSGPQYCRLKFANEERPSS